MECSSWTANSLEFYGFLLFRKPETDIHKYQITFLTLLLDTIHLEQFTEYFHENIKGTGEHKL